MIEQAGSRLFVLHQLGKKKLHIKTSSSWQHWWLHRLISYLPSKLILMLIKLKSPLLFDLIRLEEHWYCLFLFLNTCDNGIQFVVLWNHSEYSSRSLIAFIPLRQSVPNDLNWLWTPVSFIRKHVQIKRSRDSLTFLKHDPTFYSFRRNNALRAHWYSYCTCIFLWA